MQLPFYKNSAVIVCGPSQSGKTTFILNCLRNLDTLMFDDHYHYVMPEGGIYYFYKVHQPIFEYLSTCGVEFIQGCPTIEHINEIVAKKQRSETAIIILDDLMIDVGNNSDVLNIFTEGVHNHNLFVFFLTHNFYHRGKYTLSISRNSHYYVFTSHMSNITTVEQLGRRLYGHGSSQKFNEIYKCIMETPYNCLLIDMHPKTPCSDLRIRSNIFNYTHVFII